MSSQIKALQFWGGSGTDHFSGVGIRHDRYELHKGVPARQTRN